MSFTETFTTLDPARWNHANVTVSGGKAILGAGGTAGEISTVDPFTLGSLSFRLQVPADAHDGGSYVGSPHTVVTFKLLADNGDHVTALVNYVPGYSVNPSVSHWSEVGGVRSPAVGMFSQSLYAYGTTDPLQWFLWVPGYLYWSRTGPAGGSGLVLPEIHEGPWRFVVTGTNSVMLSEVDLNSTTPDPDPDPEPEPVEPDVVDTFDPDAISPADGPQCATLLSLIQSFSESVRRAVRITGPTRIEMVDPNEPLPAGWSSADADGFYYASTRRLTAGAQTLSLLAGDLALDLNASVVSDDVRLIGSGWRIPQRLPVLGLVAAPVKRVEQTFTPGGYTARLEFHAPSVPLALRRI